ncbi:hypothetical protein [Pseudomonas sp.]|uniref:hypothetical protein n=1 Tax=Pseudomonas sp. TaxID=306 RepID=UPI003FD8EC7D
MGMSHFEFFAIIVFVMAVLGLATWRQIKRTSERFKYDVEWYEEKRKAEKTKEELRIKALQDERDRRRMIYEADAYNQASNMEPFCGEGKKP